MCPSRWWIVDCRKKEDKEDRKDGREDEERDDGENKEKKEKKKKKRGRKTKRERKKNGEKRRRERRGRRAWWISEIWKKLESQHRSETTTAADVLPLYSSDGSLLTLRHVSLPFICSFFSSVTHVLTSRIEWLSLPSEICVESYSEPWSSLWESQ